MVKLSIMMPCKVATHKNNDTENVKEDKIVINVKVKGYYLPIVL